MGHEWLREWATVLSINVCLVEQIVCIFLVCNPFFGKPICCNQDLLDRASDLTQRWGNFFNMPIRKQLLKSAPTYMRGREYTVPWACDVACLNGLSTASHLFNFFVTSSSTVLCAPTGVFTVQICVTSFATSLRCALRNAYIQSYSFTHTNVALHCTIMFTAHVNGTDHCTDYELVFVRNDHHCHEWRKRTSLKRSCTGRFNGC